MANDEKENKVVSEGLVKQGGLNDRPITQEPADPVGQGGSSSQTQDSSTNKKEEK